METTFFQRFMALIGSIKMAFKIYRVQKEIEADPQLHERKIQLLDEILSNHPCPYKSKLTDEEKQWVDKIIADSTDEEKQTLIFELPKDCPLEVQNLFKQLNNDDYIFNVAYDYLYENHDAFRDYADELAGIDF